MDKINVKEFRKQFKLIEDAAVKIACAIKGHNVSDFTHIEVDADTDVVEVHFSFGWSCGDEYVDRVDINYSEFEKDIDSIIKDREETRIRNEEAYKEKIRIHKEAKLKLENKEKEERDIRDYKRLKEKFEKHKSTIERLTS